MAAYIIKPAQGVCSSSLLVRWSLIQCRTTMGAISHYLSCIVSLEESPASTEEEGIAQRHGHQKVESLGVILGSFCHKQDVNKWVESKLQVIKNGTFYCLNTVFIAELD